MNVAARIVAAGACLAVAVSAQVSTIVFTGRFPFVSRDVGNERPGGAITQLSEYDFSYAIPVPGGSIARTLLPATAMHCYLGDGNLDGNYLKFRGWKTTYFEDVGIAGLFVRDADRNAPSWDKVFFSVRLATGAGTHEFEILTNGGTPYLLASHDWARLQPNGLCEFFIAPGQLQVAIGQQNGLTTVGTSALLQAANGDLYYTPADGGHWVNGNQTGAVFAEDGAICKIDAAAITYDAAGNVAAFVPNSARILINEATPGPGGTATLLQLVDNTGAMDRTGSPIQTAGVYGRSTGLAFDPDGGTWLPSYPDGTGALPAEPNLIWCSEVSAYGGTLFSTANAGTVATLNGALCGSTTAGVPADGAWLGVQLDLANEQPSLLGMTLVGAPPLSLIADQNDLAALSPSSSQANWDIDFHGAPGVPLFALIDVGPQPPSLVVPSTDVAALPLAFTVDSWPDLFLSAPITIGTTSTDGFGYATISVANPNTGALSGFTVMTQAVGLAGSNLQLSSPLIVQLQ